MCSRRRKIQLHICAVTGAQLSVLMDDFIYLRCYSLCKLQHHLLPSPLPPLPPLLCLSHSRKRPNTHTATVNHSTTVGSAVLHCVAV